MTILIAEFETWTARAKKEYKAALKRSSKVGARHADADSVLAFAAQGSEFYIGGAITAAFVYLWAKDRGHDGMSLMRLLHEAKDKDELWKLADMMHSDIGTWDWASDDDENATTSGKDGDGPKLQRGYGDPDLKAQAIEKFREGLYLLDDFDRQEQNSRAHLALANQIFSAVKEIEES